MNSRKEDSNTKLSKRDRNSNKYQGMNVDDGFTGASNPSNSNARQHLDSSGSSYTRNLKKVHNPYLTPPLVSETNQEPRIQELYDKGIPQGLRTMKDSSRNCMEQQKKSVNGE